MMKECLKIMKRKEKLKLIPLNKFILILSLMIISLFSISIVAAQSAEWWPMFHHDAARIGYSPSIAPNTNDVLWSKSIGTMRSSPAVAYGKVFASTDYLIYALDVYTGAQIWNFSGGLIHALVPAVSNGKVIVGSNIDNKVYALNESTGETIWSSQLGGGVNNAAPAAANGKVFINAGDGKIYAFNESTGAPIINYSQPGIFHNDGPTIAYGKVFAAGLEYSGMFAYNESTGALLWNSVIGWRISPPAAANGKIYFGAWDGTLYALNESTGSVIWTYNNTGCHTYSTPAVVYGRVYGTSDKFFALNESTGALIWQTASFADCDTALVSAPAVADGKVYVVGRVSGQFYCLNASTGAIIWSYPAGSGYMDSAFAIGYGKAFSGTSELGLSMFYAFGTLLTCAAEGGTTCGPPSTCSQSFIPTTDTSYCCPADAACIPTENCSDLIQNQDETDIDCGGLICSKCEVGFNCSIDNDCIDHNCFGGICTAPLFTPPTCNDTDGDYIADGPIIDECCGAGGNEKCLGANDNCPNNYNPDQANTDTENGGNVCDACPEDASNSCNQNKTGSAYINSSGGTVVNNDSSFIMNVPAGATSGMSFSMQQAASTDINVSYRNAISLASFNIEPTGATFSQPIILNIAINITGLDKRYLSSIAIYRKNITGSWQPPLTTKLNETVGDGIGDEDGVCDCCITTCTICNSGEICWARAATTEFSQFDVSYVEGNYVDLEYVIARPGEIKNIFATLTVNETGWSEQFAVDYNRDVLNISNCLVQKGDASTINYKYGQMSTVISGFIQNGTIMQCDLTTSDTAADGIYTLDLRDHILVNAEAEGIPAAEIDGKVVIDTTRPVVTLINVPTAWRNSPAAVYIKCADATTGCAGIKYGLSSSAESCIANNNYYGSVIVTDASYLCWNATDSAGNSNTGNQSINFFDFIAPETTAQVSGECIDNDDDGYGIGQLNATVTLTATDNQSEIPSKGTGYCIDENNTCNPDGNEIYYWPFTITTNGIYYVRYQSYDNAGNVEEIKNMTVENLCTQVGDCDDTNPLINPGASDDDCNGMDENCNGLNDDNYTATPTSCGVGACAATGQMICVSGNLQNTCNPGTPAADDALCNGIDDDCDGSTDEEYAPQNVTCGIGACQATGTTYCENGIVNDSCTPGGPGADDTVCNGIDDDCNGQTDEDYVIESTTCGVGACASTGITSCVNGNELDSCTPGAPSQELCNNVDDDCDGMTDEGGNALCDDGLWCTGAETCQGSGCLGGTAPDCSDNNSCTDDSCNDNLDQCVNAINDFTAPVTTDDYLFNNSWSNLLNASVALSATDIGCGVNKTEYSVNNGPLSLYSVPLAFNADNLYNLSYFSTDNAGNQEITKQTIIKLDATKPKINISIEEDSWAGCSAGGWFFWLVWFVDSGTVEYPLVHGCVKINADIDASISGLKTYTIRLIDENGVEINTTNSHMNYNFDTANKQYTIIVEAEDNAGNPATESLQIFEDDDEDIVPDILDLCPTIKPAVDVNPKDGCPDQEGVPGQAWENCVKIYTGAAATSIYPTTALNVFTNQTIVKDSKTWYNFNSAIANINAISYINMKLEDNTVTQCSLDLKSVDSTTEKGKKKYLTIDKDIKIKEENKTDNYQLQETWKLDLDDRSKIRANTHFNGNKDETKIHITYENKVKEKVCTDACETAKKACLTGCSALPKAQQKACSESCNNNAKTCQDGCVSAYSFNIKNDYTGMKTLSLYDLLKLIGYA